MFAKLSKKLLLEKSPIYRSDNFKNACLLAKVKKISIQSKRRFMIKYLSTLIGKPAAIRHLSEFGNIHSKNGRMHCKIGGFLVEIKEV